MIRETSIEAYNKILQEGLLSPRRWEVYATVFNNGPMTSAEAFVQINQGKNLKALTQSRARFTELREMGLLQELEPRECKITKNKAIVWEVTKNLPTKLEKPITKTEKISEIVKHLEKSHLLVSDIFQSQEVFEHIQKSITKLKNLI